MPDAIPCGQGLAYMEASLQEWKDSSRPLFDGFAINQAAFWAGRLIEREDDSPRDRIEWMFRKALGRPPSQPELEGFEDLVTGFARLHRVSQNELLTSEKVWRDACHAMFNTKEMIYLW